MKYTEYLDKRNQKIYDKIVTTSKSIYVNDLTDQTIRNIHIDKYLGAGKDTRAIYLAHCIKCNQKLIITSHMLSDERVHLCYCDINTNLANGKKHTGNYKGHSNNLGKYAKKKYDFDIRDPEIEPLFDTWVGIRQRCNNPKQPAYPHYGARGIKVCPEWDNKEDGFLNFYNWAMSQGWKARSGLSIDRIDVNKGYSPENCRWATTELQNSNQTSNRYIQYNCWIFPLNIWAKIANIDYYKFYMRINNGWGFEKAMFTDTPFSDTKIIIVPEEYDKFNKYDEWVNNGKIDPVPLPLMTACPVIDYFDGKRKINYKRKK